MISNVIKFQSAACLIVTCVTLKNAASFPQPGVHQIYHFVTSTAFFQMKEVLFFKKFICLIGAFVRALDDIM